MMVDELLSHALSSAEIATARRRTQQQSDKKKSALYIYHSFDGVSAADRTWHLLLPIDSEKAAIEWLSVL
jgi:hypothetical protein